MNVNKMVPFSRRLQSQTQFWSFEIEKWPILPKRGLKTKNKSRKWIPDHRLQLDGVISQLNQD